LSINPDAHEIQGYKDMYYGICVGRKGGLTREMNLNSMSMRQIDDFFINRKKGRLSRSN